MIEFMPVTLKDRDWVQAIITEQNLRSATLNFTNMFIWANTYRIEIARIGGRLAVRLGYCSAPYYGFPVGEGDLSSVIGILREDAAGQGATLKLRGVLKEQTEALENLFPGRWDFCPERFAFDYIYSLEKLAELSGKKLHAKRNHIHRLEKERNWNYELIDPGSLDECARMNDRWVAETVASRGGDYENEHEAFSRAIANYRELELEGGLIRSGGEVIAFAIGDKLCADTFDIHFEKAFPGINGAYSLINREFARYIRSAHPEIIYLNREEDLGIENLAKAKMSYHPDFLLEKYTAVWK